MTRAELIVNLFHINHHTPQSIKFFMIVCQDLGLIFKQ